MSIRGDKFIYIISQDNELRIGGGSSTKAQVRVFNCRVKAEQIRDRHFPKAQVICYSRYDLLTPS